MNKFKMIFCNLQCVSRHNPKVFNIGCIHDVNAHNWVPRGNACVPGEDIR